MKESRPHHINEDSLFEETDMGHCENIQYLLDHGVNGDAINGLGETALVMAVQNRDLPVVELLLLNKVDLNKIDKQGFAPVHHAAKLIEASILKHLILNGANVQLVTKDGMSALDLGVVLGREAVWSLLLDQKIDPFKPDSLGRTPVFWASLSKNWKFLEKVLEKHGQRESVDQKNNNNRQAFGELKNGLIYSTVLGAVENVKVFLTHVPFAINSISPDSKSLKALMEWIGEEGDPVFMAFLKDSAGGGVKAVPFFFGLWLSHNFRSLTTCWLMVLTLIFNVLWGQHPSCGRPSKGM